MPRCKKPKPCDNDEVSIFKLKVSACLPENAEMMTLPVELLVDTSCELTWLPAEMLRGIGVVPQSKRTFCIPHKLTVEREVGRATLQANGHTTEAEVVFAAAGDALAVGVEALKGFGIALDAAGFVSVATLATFCMAEKTAFQKAA